MPFEVTSGAKTVSKTKAAKCSQHYDDCAKSTLCHSSNYAMRDQCKGRCMNRQAKCLGLRILSGAGTTYALDRPKYDQVRAMARLKPGPPMRAVRLVV
jgi:hypothetical protein